MDERAAAAVERLHKVLARAGVASRRQSEVLISQGRVKVDGKTVTALGTKVDPTTQHITFDGQPVSAEQPAHYVVYKPKGVVCTTDDQFDRKSVVSLVRDRRQRRLFPVGRMEEDSEGLILVTNDGTFANKVVSYKNPLRHVYFLRIRGDLTQQALEQVRKGVWLSDGPSGPMWVKVQRWGKQVSTVLASPSAQQHRLLKRAFAKVGLVADKVVRVRIGAITTEGLKKGMARRLTPAEVHALLNPAPGDVSPAFGGQRRRQHKPGDRRGQGPSRGGPPRGGPPRSRPSRGSKPSRGRPSTAPSKPSSGPRSKAPREAEAPTPRRRVIGP